MMIRSVSFMSVVNISRASTQVAINIISARFITPHDYGLVAFSMSFILFIALLTDLGLSSAIVRHPDLDRRQVGAAATLITLFGALLAISICLGAPALSSVSNLEGLTSVLAGLALSIVFAVAAVAPRALLERHLDYQRIAAIEGSAVAIGFLTYLVALLCGVGVMALVLYQIAMHLVRAIAFTVIVRKQMTFNFEWSRLKPLMAFGGWVLLTNALNFLARTAGPILIGIYLGAASVGLYGFANQFMIMPLVVLAWPASNVLMSALGPQAGLVPESKSSLTMATMAMTALVTFPGMFYFVFGTGFLVDHLLDPKWHEAIWLMKVLAPIGAVQSIAAYSGSVILARGEGSLNFRLSVINSLVFFGTFVFMLPYGLHVFAIGYAVTGLAMAALSLVVVFYKIDASGMSLVNAFLPPTVASCLGVAVVWSMFGADPGTFMSWLKATATYAAVVLLVYLGWRKIIGLHFTTMRKSLIGRKSSEAAAAQPA
ncbi:lipopolysaccharide biosynthesis protein [Bradyrhizobium canariense]|uniref:lipopolysaccharide biosynthesis protein n=1 Tax=Bradyrhizobium canariense TaxID=255045 RepID=UPI001B8A2661|nr:lipopolysaccharide biosynthesis protein [Bradyrhizobium canariense]MBR0954365.1 lipopolysaccharide biosynthesis protein [Bradyrhizobium canariense]